MKGRYITAKVLREREAQLTNLDRELLRSVSDLRFVTGAQLSRMHYGTDTASARAARRALLRLTRLEMLDHLPRRVGGVRAGSAGFVFVLGLAGQKLAMTKGWQPERRGRRPQTPGTLFLRHRLDVAELHVQLREADRSGRLEVLELVAEPACHRDYAGLGKQRVLKPDSFVRYGLGDYEWSWFIEVDRGTEGSGAIQAKLRDYVAYEASGTEQASRGVFPKVIWTVPDEARTEALAADIRRLPSGRELFAVSRFDAALHTLTQSGDLPAGVE